MKEWTNHQIFFQQQGIDNSDALSIKMSSSGNRNNQNSSDNEGGYNSDEPVTNNDRSKENKPIGLTTGGFDDLDRTTVYDHPLGDEQDNNDEGEGWKIKRRS